MKRALLAATCLVVPSLARADPNLRAGGVGRVDAQAVEWARSRRTELRGEFKVGALLRVALTPPSLPVGAAAGLDYRLGVTWPAAFAFEANLQPLGIGFLPCRSVQLLATTGIGVSGVTAGLLPISGQVPLDVRLEVDLPGPLHGSLWWRPTWLFAERRGNEFTAGLGLRTGTEDEHYEADYGSGFFIGTEYSERQGSHAIGLVFGHEFDGIYLP